MAAHVLPIAAFAVLLPWSMYRRVRRNIGRQEFSALRLKARAAVVLVILALVLRSVLQREELAPALLALTGGGLAGVLVGLFALRHTRFERVDGKLSYTPHTWIGAAVSMLLVVRIGWRAVQLWPALMSAEGLQGYHFGPMSPLTLATLGLVLCYYAAYHLSLVRQARIVPSP